MSRITCYEELIAYSKKFPDRVNTQSGHPWDRGYIYIATQPSMPNWIKFGRTSNKPWLRLENLSKSTPRKFKLERYWSMPYVASVEIEKSIKEDYYGGWFSKGPNEELIWASDWYNITEKYVPKEWFHLTDEPESKKMMIKAISYRVIEALKFYRKNGRFGKLIQRERTENLHLRQIIKSLIHDDGRYI